MKYISGKIKRLKVLSSLVLLCALCGSVALFAGDGLPDYLQKEVAKLIKQLGDESWEKREAATNELIRIGPRARPAIEKAQEDPDAEIRERVRQIRFIMRWQEAFLSRLDKLIQHLRKGSIQDPNLLQQVIDFLKSDESIFLLVDFLKDPDQIVGIRQQIANALGNIRISLKPIISELIDIWKQEKESSVKQGLMRAFAKVGADERIKPIIMEVAQGKDYNLRVRAIETLGKIKDDSFLPELFKFLRDSNSNIRNTALYALNRYPHTKTIADELFKLLREKIDARFKAQIISILINFNDKRLLPEILKLIKTEKDNQILRVIFQNILPRYRKEPSVAPVLIDCLKQGDAKMRAYAIDALKSRGEKAAIPEIIKLIEEATDFNAFNSLVSSLQALSKTRFLPQAVPQELKETVLSSAQEWWEKNK